MLQFKKSFQNFILLILYLFELNCRVTSDSNTSTTVSVPSTHNSLEVDKDFSEIGCDPLHAEDTAVACFPPTVGSNGFENSTDCSERSVPGTIASYSCRNFRGVVYTGFLNCANSGVWIVSFTLANNSLCNLDASIVNFQLPDLVIATDEPEFTTPFPNEELLQENSSGFKDYEKTALQLHNIFRRNHGIPFVKMSKQLNSMAQALVDSITSSEDLQDVESQFKLNPIHRTMNVEMNWYFQVPSSPSNVKSVSNAIQSWYSGFGKYEWETPEKSLDVRGALAFTRVIWKATQLIGVGVASLDNITFVICAYTPGRNIESIDPVNEFTQNVLPFKIG